MENNVREGLALRAKRTAALYKDPYNPRRYIERGRAYYDLNYHDLAAADAYRAITLIEALEDPSTEYAAKIRDPQDTQSTFIPYPAPKAKSDIQSAYRLVIPSLLLSGCLRDAKFYRWQAQSVEGLEDDEDLDGFATDVDFANDKRKERGASDVQGYAKREVYPWNNHEPDRSSQGTLRKLNENLSQVAPKCEVRVVTLPKLFYEVDGVSGTWPYGPKPTSSTQLGLFAKEDIAPREVVLEETSLLTATNRFHDNLCDACNAPLPELSSSQPPVACSNCDDTIFCSLNCQSLAQEKYHPAVCGKEGLESIGKDVSDPKDAADSLYLLLLARAIAMAETQKKHPLDLPEVKYIWGDFQNFEGAAECMFPYSMADESRARSATLPFSFQLNIVQPLRILEEMGIDPYASLQRYDTWIFNTLYAKFRGTASGRLSTWDGGPEVSAVHPMWCLANHSCDPNVTWEWGGQITFRARETRVRWSEKDELERQGGIMKGEEILNHYCDISLGVKERREWATGALGGSCKCERCRWEAGEEDESVPTGVMLDEGEFDDGEFDDKWYDNKEDHAENPFHDRKPLNEPNGEGHGDEEFGSRLNEFERETGSKNYSPQSKGTS